MLTYVYNPDQDNWLEESNLLYHDICALLDQDEKVIYIWKGPKSTEERFERSYRSANKLLSNYPKDAIELKVLEKTIPEAIQSKLDQMLDMIKKTEQKKTVVFSRYSTIKAYYYLSLVQCILPFIIFLNFIGLSFLPQDGNANIIVDPVVYDFWINFGSVLAVIMVIIFISLMIIGFVEQDIQAGIFALAGLVAAIGVFSYLQQGIFLFIFESGSSSEVYYIALLDLWVFIIIMAGVLALIEVPTMYKFMKFKKDYSDYLSV